jgi:exopolysaccharide production protein ExoY
MADETLEVGLNSPELLRSSTFPYAGGSHVQDRDRAYQIAKRVFDFIIALLCILLFAPVMLLAAIAIKIESPGPAIFKQRRVGRGEKEFVLYKFRGMYSDALTRFPELYTYHYDHDDLNKLFFHTDNDPRVTRVGRFLRKTSIDELPNLWNVLRGDISLVGPRPEIPEMLPYYGDAASIVLSVRPGVTSLAKAGGRDRLSFVQTLDLDLEYVRKRSFGLDLRILARTVVAVLRRDGVS